MATTLDLVQVELDPAVQPRVRVDVELVKEYAAEMRAGAAFPPIDVVWDGQAGTYWVWDGFHRVMAARRIGRQWLMANVVPGTREDARWRALAANATHGLRRTNADKRRVVVLALKHPKGAGMSDRRIGQHCAVHHSTVSAIRKELEASGEIQEVGARAVTRGGSTYTMDTSGIGTAARRTSPAARGNPPGSNARASPPPGESDAGPGPGRHDGGDGVGAPASRSMGATAVSSDGSTGEDRCVTAGQGEPAGTCTHPAIDEAVAACLGAVDLDPCAGRHAEAEIPAQRRLGADERGLGKAWHGRVGLKPPRGRAIGDWIAKLCEEYEAGRTTAAVAIVPARTDDGWWKQIAACAAALCFIDGRHRCVEGEPIPSRALVAFYLGSDTEAFCRSFGQLGDLWARVSVPAEAIG
jgi:hypothetical protein